MSETIVILVNGEALENMDSPGIDTQKEYVQRFAEGLSPILSSNKNIFIIHGNKPQVGFVLYRGEIASHILHPSPLDICGADTQGATGYMLSLAILNELRKINVERETFSIVTETKVDINSNDGCFQKKAIGPWFDRQRAKILHQTKKWELVEDPGYGYRRVVPLYKPVEVLGIKAIKSLVDAGKIVIAAGGGGIPVCVNENGMLQGIESVIDTDAVASIIADELDAETLIMVVEGPQKFARSNISIYEKNSMKLAELEEMIANDEIPSSHVRNKIESAKSFLINGSNRTVVITTIHYLEDTLNGKNGLTITL